jgi:hypothetical protein
LAPPLTFKTNKTMAKKQMDPGPKKKIGAFKQEYRVYKSTGKKAQVMPTSIQKSKGPSVGSGNPFAGPSKPRKSAYSEAAQKRMKAEAEGTFRPIYTSASMTRVLPEMTGKLTVKAPVKKPSIKKKK